MLLFSDFLASRLPSNGITSNFWKNRTVHCESQKSEDLKKADPDKLRSIFNKYASVEEKGEKLMTADDFIRRFLGLMHDEKNYNEDTVKLLANVVDTTKDGLISFVEFQAFETQLLSPDSLYSLAFQVFDTNSSGYVTYDEFEDVLSKTDLHQHFPFNFNSKFIELHFGKDKQRNVSYTEFTQLLHDFYEEHALQAFLKYDKDQEGFISAIQFQDIMTRLKSYLLTSFVHDNIITVVMHGTKSKKVSYPYFTAFISLLNNMELIKQIYLSASNGKHNKDITKEEMLHEIQKYTQITPMEIDILFQLAELNRPTGTIRMEDIKIMAPLDEELLPFQLQELDFDPTKNRSIFIQMLESGYRFALGSVAGAVGATAVYPIDLVKTRMQNQRSASYIQELMYKNSMDCFKKVVKHEGVLGLYRGLLPQIVGVAPEKAIKLTMNDFVRDKFTTNDGQVPLFAEILAGGAAGGSQVIFTNPLEIVKIRLQVAGEIAATQRLGAMAVIKELGFFGLYKGAAACFARDIPFSAIFFPLYAHLKKMTANRDGYNTIPSLLLSATLSGAPAAALVTPADVVKTRLQVVARKGQTTYSGLFDCARKVFAEEGFRAFWKGAPARVFRSSPQFGVTLATYELLQRVLVVDFGGRQPVGSVKKKTKHDLEPKNPDHIGGYRLALATFEGIETKFGLSLPKFRNPNA